MQRRQLAEQQAVLKDEVHRNRQRDALMAGQLRELEQRSLTYERLQAEDIDVRQSRIKARLPDSDQKATHRVHTAEVANNSRRPIRNVASRIEPEPGGSMLAAVRVGLKYEIDPVVAVTRHAGPPRSWTCRTGRTSRSSGLVRRPASSSRRARRSIPKRE
jgi:hypothetical protein